LEEFEPDDFESVPFFEPDLESDFNLLADPLEPAPAATAPLAAEPESEEFELFTFDFCVLEPTLGALFGVVVAPLLIQPPPPEAEPEAPPPADALAPPDVEAPPPAGALLFALSDLDVVFCFLGLLLLFEIAIQFFTPKNIACPLKSTFHVHSRTIAALRPQ